MFRRIIKSAWWLHLAFLGHIALADQSYQLNVSAEIPPRLCEYPEICEPVQANIATKVTIENGEVHYVGSPPEVSQSEEMMTILF